MTDGIDMTSLEARVAALETHKLALKDLPLAALQQKLTNDWLADGMADAGVKASALIMSNVSGPWSAALPPSPTAGVALTCPTGGVLRGLAYCSGYVTGATNLFVQVYLDGALRGLMQLGGTVSVSARLTLTPCVFQVPVSAGVHYLYYRQTAGTSDGSDVGGFIGVITPT